MKKKVDRESEEAARLSAEADRHAAWRSASYLPCPFCGTQPRVSPMQGVWCDNDNCAIVGTVFSGGPRHWNARAQPLQTDLFSSVTEPALCD